MGFDNECIPNIQNLAGEYFCPVCRMLVYPNEALQSQCTHLYCKPCLNYIAATTRACPYDGYLVTHENSKPLLQSNQALAETIGKIAVRCLYNRSGCTWQGSLSDCTLHCSACAFGNSPVVCNRCAVQIVHSQVQEHAQTCPGVPSQGQTAEGTQSSAVATGTNQLQTNLQGATSSQTHVPHMSAAVIPGHVSDQPVNPNLNLPLFAQAGSDLSQQQQHYQQYAGYDPYQQHYQQMYQQHPHLQHQPQVQSMPPPAAHPQVHTLQQQQQPPSVVHTQPHAQQYPNLQNQAHPMIHPQSHNHLQSHSLAQPLPNQFQLHPHAPQHSKLHPQQLHMPQYLQNRHQAQPQLHQQNSQVHPHTHPLQANLVNHHLSISSTHVDHSYHLQSQSAIPQQPSGYPYPQEGYHQQQQHALQAQNQVSQPLMSPTELQAINQQNPSVMTSSHHEHLQVLHHRSPVQASGKLLAPQHQQVPVTTPLMNSQPHSSVSPPMPLQNVAKTQIGRTCEQLQTYPGTTEGAAFNGLHKQLETLNGSQSEPNNMSAEKIAATGCVEVKETSLIEDNPLPSVSASGRKVPSDENGVRGERVDDSEDHNSVGTSASVLSNLKGDTDKLKSKRMDSEIIHIDEKPEVAGTNPQVLDSDGQMMVNASSNSLKGNSTTPSSLIPYPNNSFDDRQPYIHHSGSFSEPNLTRAGLKTAPDSLHAFGWRDEGFRAPQDKILMEQGSIRFLRENPLQFPRPPNVESELHKHGEFFTKMSYERDPFGVHMNPRPLDKSLYRLHHDKHLQPGAYPQDNRLNLSRDSQNVASIYGRHFGVPQAIPDREHPSLSSHAIRYGSRAELRLGTVGRDQSLLAPVKPLNLFSGTPNLSFISSTSSNLHPHLHQGSFSGQTRIAELSGLGSISSLGEVGYRNNLLLTENQFHKADLELYENIRKRKAAAMGWCRICKVDCDTVEGLDLHSQTREHQRMSIDMVLKIKQQNSKQQIMKQSNQDYRI